jgi:hypothetical protein
MASLDEILALGRNAASRQAARAAIERGKGGPPSYQEASARPNGLAYGALSAATSDPAERAALRMRESVQPSRGRAYSPGLETALRTGLEFAPYGIGPVMGGINAVTGGSPADVGLSTVASGALPKWARVLGGIGGMAMEPEEAEAGVGGIARKGVGLAKQLIERGMTGIRAYHGSPYDFTKFDINKIGTGEGAQSFGHGLYFAEHEPTALSYKHSTSDLKDWPIVGGNPDWRVPSWVGKTASASPTGLDEMIGTFTDRAQQMQAEGHWNAAGIQDIADALKAVKGGQAELKRPGHMYEVNINAKPEQFLDWDKRLSQMSPEVQKALNDAWLAHPEAHAGQTGEQIYGNAEISLHQPGQGHLDRVVAAEKLRDAGIPGIKYLDQGSRAAGQGTQNYAVFRDDIIDVLRKYGMGGMAGPLLGLAGQGDNEPTPRARGGDVEPGHPYLVGEEGPEVVVPRQPGTVLAMEDTRDPFNPLGGRMRPGEGGTSRGKNITAEEAAHRVGVADALNKKGVLGTGEAAGATILDKGTPEVQAAYRRGIEEGLQKYFTPKD